jgi:2-succinyl-5-enolpyruvyl-6-hydroxy-3-cyclohexene-1-carboxylate synthase
MNERWCAILIDQLVRLGVDYFCIGPGSRSTPLVVSIAEHPSVKTMVHFDERGLAFHALGVARGTQKPVVIIATSGTAVGNLYPAVMEASLARIPLLLLTADRPPELRDCGANQTLDQVNIFGRYLRWEADLPCPTEKLPFEHYLRSTLSQAVFRARTSPQGPVQLNCMFREPFFSSSEEELKSFDPTIYEPCRNDPEPSRVAAWAATLSSIEKGIIIVGMLPSASSFASLFAVAEKLNWPIFPDILSGMRSSPSSSHVIAHYDLILKSISHLQPEAILHLGDRFVSKTLLEWIDRVHPKLYFSSSDHPFRQDPKHKVTHRFPCDPLLLCEKLLPLLLASSSSTWLNEWHMLSQIVRKTLPTFHPLTEPGLISSLLQLPSEWALFLANSMPIRDADLFFFPEEEKGPIFGNRGVSGIDGNIATAIGFAHGSRRPAVALLGDQAALHDINSLALLKKSSVPVIFLIVNNGGGGIFSFLPIAQKKKIMEEYFAAAHNFSFEGAAEMFQIPYFCPSSSEQWNEIWHNSLEEKQSCIIEVITDRQENYLYHQSLYHQLKEQLCSAIASPVL